MNIKKKITKKVWLKLLLFIAVIAGAAFFDYVFDDDIAAFDKIETEANKNAANPNTVYLYNPSFLGSVKSTVQIVSDKKPHLKFHDKLIQNYHRIRNYQVLKAEVQEETSPLISTYHYLAFKNYFFTDPDKDPHIS